MQGLCRLHDIYPNAEIIKIITMKSDFDTLVEFYKKERKFIEGCIKNNIKEMEYLHAHHHSEALFRIDHKLHVLETSTDPFHDEKRRLELTVIMYERLNRKHQRSNLASYYKKKLDEYKDRLQKLNQESKKPIVDDQKIDDAIFALVDGTYSGFVLYLNAKNNLGITFELHMPLELIISVGVKEVFNIEYFLANDDPENIMLNRFRSLGFALNGTGTKFNYYYDMATFKDAIAIKVLLARLIYDIFTYAELDKPASLVYF
jgi:hypothetical protein